jgi:hypothetical protein
MYQPGMLTTDADGVVSSAHFFVASMLAFSGVLGSESKF